MVRIKELGTFKVDYKEKKCTPTTLDWSDRQLWLNQIQCLDYHSVGDSNYSYDQIGTYNLIFNVNAGDNMHSLPGGDWNVFIVQVEFNEWYRSDEAISEELEEALAEYPILNIEDTIAAFSQRRYYRDCEKFNIS